jgi:chloramphenicol O-acetyltransferase type A
MMMKKVDLESWPRKQAYLFFKDFEDPYFSMTADTDVTVLRSFCKSEGLSFSLATLFAATTVANEIREFRLRQDGDDVVEYEVVHASQTILNEDETFSFSFLEYVADFRLFERNGLESIRRYKELKTLEVELERMDVIFYSVIPWVSFTSFKNAQRRDHTSTVPRIVFGKLHERDGRLLMPVSVEVNHMMMDGVHVGRFFQKFQEILDTLPKTSGTLV